MLVISDLNSVSLIAVMVKALTSGKEKAVVPHPEVYGKVNRSLELSCESGKQPLSFCVWENTADPHGEIIIVDQAAIKNGGATPVHGIFSTTDGLDNATANAC